jgi:hypothetical protein
MDTPNHLAAALYFEDRAKRARQETERDRFLLVAQKYRALAKEASDQALDKVQNAPTNGNGARKK